MPQYTSRSRSVSSGRHARYSRSSAPRRKPAFQKDYIDPSRFIRAAQPAQAEQIYQPENMFGEFAISDLLKTNLQKLGFKEPTPIQDKTIALGLAGQDVVGIANTGTGKTIAFALPLLHQLLTNPDAQALIMAPTRELAQQIEDDCRRLAKGAGFYGALLIGGVSMSGQLRDLRRNPRIIIGTPGRIKDHIERGTVRLEQCNIVVLDEVDRMLDMGFIHDIRFILDTLHPERQSFFFSATLEGKIRELVTGFLHEPAIVSVKTGETSDNIAQDVVRYDSNTEKMDKLHDLLNDQALAKVIIFDETQRNVEGLFEELLIRGFKVDAIHGGKNQSQRQRAMNRFKRNEVTILVATDVAARGIDVNDVTHVINYTTPQSYEDYVHRIGRAGRAGRPGFALTFVPMAAERQERPRSYGNRRRSYR